jgi:hypothetical protein
MKRVPVLSEIAPYQQFSEPQNDPTPLPPRKLVCNKLHYILLSENSGTSKDTEKFISNHYENSGKSTTTS